MLSYSCSSTVHYQAFRKHQGRDTDTISVDAVEFIAMLAQHIPHAHRHQGKEKRKEKGSDPDI